MSPAEEPFLDAILSRPADDGPRLILADFLDESGDPADAARADLIRVQLALARLPAYHPRRPELADRQADLLRRHLAAWSAPLADLVAGVTFRRGLPDTVSMEAAAFVGGGADLFRRTRVGGRSFVRRVRLLDPARVFPRLVRSPHLAAVAELDLSHGELGNGGAGLLARCPHLGGLKALDYGWNGADDAGVRLLARSAAFPALQSLALNDNGPVTAAGAQALADSPFLAGLVELDLSGNELTDAGVRALAAGRATGRLHTLRLAGNDIGDAGVATLIRSGLFARLLARDPSVDLRENEVGPAGAEALARCPELGRVAGLDLRGNHLGDRGVTALADSGRLGGLRTLRLNLNRVTDAGAFALAAGLTDSPRLRALDVLSGNDGITPRGRRALGELSRHLGCTLDVSVRDGVAEVLAAMADRAADALRALAAGPARRGRG